MPKHAVFVNSHFVQITWTTNTYIYKDVIGVVLLLNVQVFILRNVNCVVIIIVPIILIINMNVTTSRHGKYEKFIYFTKPVTKKLLKQWKSIYRINYVI